MPSFGWSSSETDKSGAGSSKAEIATRSKSPPPLMSPPPVPGTRKSLPFAPRIVSLPAGAEDEVVAVAAVEGVVGRAAVELVVARPPLKLAVMSVGRSRRGSRRGRRRQRPRP